MKALRASQYTPASLWQLPEVWPRIRELLGDNLASISRALISGLIMSLVTVPVQLVWEYPTGRFGSTWFRNLGFPIPWIGAWKSPAVLDSPSYHFYPYSWGFIQNLLFWSVIAFAIIFMRVSIQSKMRSGLLPAYVVGLAWARIQLEFQMAIAAKGSIVAFARIDPFSYAQITSYFAMALLLFPVVIAVVGRLDFKETFRLCSLGFPVILLPPILDNYILARPVVYNFFTASYPNGGINPLNIVEVLSPGIKLEILLVATSAFVYLFYRTRSVLRSATALLGAFLLFVFVSTPLVTARLNLSLSQPQLFAGYLVLTYGLIIVSFSLAQPELGRLIAGRTRLRGIHFPAMTLFGVLLVHPDILAAGIPEDLGVAIAGIFVVFLVWQLAVIFDDVFDRDEKAPPGYLAFGILTAVIALLAAMPLGAVPWLLVLAAVYLAIDYSRLRRRHYLLSGAVIGFSSSIAFLYGTALPILSASSSSEPVALVGLAIAVMFAGASFLKDITSIEADKESGIATVFTGFEVNRTLGIVATFVAFGFVFPAVLFSGFFNSLLFLAAGASVWFLIVLLKHRSYEPVLALYFVEGLCVFFGKFFCAFACK